MGSESSKKFFCQLENIYYCILASLKQENKIAYLGKKQPLAKSFLQFLFTNRVLNVNDIAKQLFFWLID